MGEARQHDKWRLASFVAAFVVLAAAGVGVAAAADSPSAAGVPTVNCPSVPAGRLGAVPASAQAEVTRNLQLLNTQISEANNRLRTSVGQGGPNFINNAILGPLEDKRTATLNRIETAIGRQGVRPEGLETFAACTLNQNGGASAQQSVAVPRQQAAQQGGQQAAAGAQTVNCPSVPAGRLGAVPASAQAEVTRNLQLLNTQISEANNRLRTSVGQGGPNFINNAILGPLEDKRTATLNRIETAIGRQGVRPEGLETFAACTLNQNGGASAQQSVAVPQQQAAQQGGQQAAAGAQTVNCPSVPAGRLGAVPASAQAEVTRNLQLLNTQINEANNRLRTSVGQGGPNFINNAILGPLEDKRTATLNRIETAIGRQGVRPEGLETFAACTLNG